MGFITYNITDLTTFKYRNEKMEQNLYKIFYSRINLIKK